MFYHCLAAVMTLGFCLLCHDSIIAQSGGMTQQYFLEGRSTRFCSLTEYNEDILVVGQSGRDSNGISSVFVLQIDTLGNIKKLDFYQDPTLTDDVYSGNYSYYDGILRSPDGGLVLFGSMLSRNNLYMLKLDSTLGLEYIKEYDSDFFYRSVHDVFYIDSSYYTIGEIQQLDLNIDIFVQKTDFFGNKIWEKTFGSHDNRDLALSGIVENAGITILGGEFNDPNSDVFNDEHFWTKIFHIDTSGEELWFWRSEDREEGVNAGSLLKKGSNYIYQTMPSYQVNFATIWRAAQIVSRDEDFNLNWRHTYGDTFHLNHLPDLIVGSDSNIYATGQIADTLTWGVVYKINSDDGEVIWTARDTGIHIPGWGSRNLMSGIIEIAGGSLIAVGTTFDAWTNHEHGLIFRVTPDGCIDTICTTTSIEEYLRGKESSVSVFPNPASDYINFKLIEPGEALELRIFSFDGKYLHHQNLSEGINTIYLGKENFYTGIYLWQIVTPSGDIKNFGRFILMN